MPQNGSDSSLRVHSTPTSGLRVYSAAGTGCTGRVYPGWEGGTSTRTSMDPVWTPVWTQVWPGPTSIKDPELIILVRRQIKDISGRKHGKHGKQQSYQF